MKIIKYKELYLHFCIRIIYEQNCLENKIVDCWISLEKYWLRHLCTMKRR